MFRTCTHFEVAPSLETINAAFAIIEIKNSNFVHGAELVSANTMFEAITARPILECINRPLADIFPIYLEKQFHQGLESCLVTQLSQEAEILVERDSVRRWWRLLASPLIPNADGSRRMILTLFDITDKKLLENNLGVAKQRYEAVVNSAYDGIITVDQDQTIMLMNESARRMFGVEDDDKVIGDKLSRFIPQRYRDVHNKHVTEFRKSVIDVRPMQSRSTLLGLRTDGKEIPIEVTISKIKFHDKAEMTAVVRDISEQTKLIDELQKASTHDALTGTYNRRHGDVVLNNEIQRCRRYEDTLTVAMIDVDNFKAINDDYGHFSGDVVLKSVVDLLSASLRDADHICRWGGDEFLVLLPETQPGEAQNWAERVRASLALQEIAVTGDLAIKVSVSIGLSTLNSDDSTPEDLLRRADRALYSAKGSGRNRVMTETA